MFNDLKEIKILRKRLGINQKELAKKAGVSQSLIAKIEAEKIEPTYTKVKKIFDALKQMEEKEELKARDLMTKKTISIESKDLVKKAIRLMKEKGISQLPVMKDKTICGIINEKIIIDLIAEGRDISNIEVEKIMGEVPPIISLNTNQKIILELLKEYSIVLVANKGSIKGLISKSDLLRI